MNRPLHSPRSWPPAFWATAVLCSAALLGQEETSAARYTEPGRTLARPIDLVLAGKGDGSAERTLVVVLDPSPGLAAAGFADAFDAALAARAHSLRATSLALVVAGRETPVAVEPTRDHAAVGAAIRRELASPQAGFVNVYAALVDAAAVAVRGEGQAVLMLVSLENGDLEDQVDRTVYELQRREVVVEVLTSEATLADSYWARRPNQQRPRDTELTGGDAALIDLPWGFLLQREPANELTPSGYAPWGLTRIAAGTGGRVFLHAASHQTGHECLPFGTCLFCSGDHTSPEDRWNSALVAQLAPLAEARDDVLRTRGSDPVFRAMVKTWTEAAKKGLLGQAPPIKIGGTTASPDRPRQGRRLGLFSTASFARNAQQALKAARDAAALRDRLASQIEEHGADGSARSVAAARYLVVMLQLTRLNLMIYAAWCRDEAPKWFDDPDREVGAPEIPPFDVERRPSGVSYHNLALCHGVRPFFDVELPGGDEVQGELRVLDGLFSSYLLRYGKSPFGYALRKNGIVRFHPTYPGISKGPARRRPKSELDEQGPVTPRRPTRRGSSSAPASGPTTGGGGR